MWYGTGISDLDLMLMWRFPNFDLPFYFKESSWTVDALVPMLLLAVAAALAVRSVQRFPLRVLLITMLTHCFLMGTLLPLQAGRYSYHLVPLLILVDSVALVAIARGLVRLVRVGCRRSATDRGATAAESRVRNSRPAAGPTSTRGRWPPVACWRSWR